jgi:hypothetical protein
MINHSQESVAIILHFFRPFIFLPFTDPRAKRYPDLHAKVVRTPGYATTIRG